MIIYSIPIIQNLGDFLYSAKNNIVRKFRITKTRIDSRMSRLGLGRCFTIVTASWRYMTWLHLDSSCAFDRGTCGPCIYCWPKGLLQYVDMRKKTLKILSKNRFWLSDLRSVEKPKMEFSSQRASLFASKMFFLLLFPFLTFSSFGLCLYPSICFHAEFCASISAFV